MPVERDAYAPSLNDLLNAGKELLRIEPRTPAQERRLRQIENELRGRLWCERCIDDDPKHCLKRDAKRNGRMVCPMTPFTDLIEEALDGR